MNKGTKNIVLVILFAVLILSFSLLCILKPAPVFSESERRYLASFPEFSIENIFSGKFMKEFETYATERFFERDSFRALKAKTATNILGKLDNNGLYVADGHISKIDNVENIEMMDYASKRFFNLYNLYMKDTSAKVYFSIIPDKNFVLAQNNGYPHLNYEGFIEKMKEKTDYMTYIDVTFLLDKDDYYTTDSHWRQEKIIDIAEEIANKMGTEVSSSYEEEVLDNDFYGVYHGQLAMDFKPDEIVYLTNDTLKACKVTYYDMGVAKEREMYDMEKAYGLDPYEMFLSGTTPLVVIDNPKATEEKKLVIFRDSFGSSLAPLMVEGYSKIFIVDIRYMQSELVGNYVDFEGSDVLFIYSTTLLNNSLAMK